MPESLQPSNRDHKHAVYGVLLENSSHKLHPEQFLCFHSEVLFPFMFSN